MQTTTFNGTTVNLAGIALNVGDAAPTVIATGTDLSDVEIGGAKDKIQLIITVPSLDTDTCAAETRRFNVDVNNLDICETTVVSMDYINKDVSRAFGVLMDDNKPKGLSARAVFVIDRSGTIVYKEIVSEVTAEPNYEAALEAIKEAR
jgi:thiol peroxidase